MEHALDVRLKHHRWRHDAQTTQVPGRGRGDAQRVSAELGTGRCKHGGGRCAGSRCRWRRGTASTSPTSSRVRGVWRSVRVAVGGRYHALRSVPWLGRAMGHGNSCKQRVASVSHFATLRLRLLRGAEEYSYSYSRRSPQREIVPFVLFLQKVAKIEAVGTKAVKGKGKHEEPKGKHGEIVDAQQNKGARAGATLRPETRHPSPAAASAAFAPAPTATVKMNWLASTSAVFTNHIRSGCCSRM